MKEGRASFRDLLGRIDAHLRFKGEEARLPELEEFWRAVESPSVPTALAAYEKLLGLAHGQGFDVELLPFVEAARVWSRKVRAASLRPKLPGVPSDIARDQGAVRVSVEPRHGSTRPSGGSPRTVTRR
jgi:hypothetical protein